MTTQDELKSAAASAAAAMVENGMIVGLGSGTTAAFAVTALAERVAKGLSITGIATSEKTAALARGLGITVAALDDYDRIDVTIDGADEVERGTLNVIKGRGGALLREKIVASASERLVLVVDEEKLVDRLCPEQQPIPVEVETFGWKGTASRLRALGASLTQRITAKGEAFVSDGGHFILDCVFPRFDSARKIERSLNDVVGVVEHGLFIGMASEVVVGYRRNDALNEVGVVCLYPQVHAADDIPQSSRSRL